MKLVLARPFLLRFLAMLLPGTLLASTCMAQALSSSKAITSRDAAAGKAPAATARAKVRRTSRNAQAIVVLVNDQPITRFDLKQRAGLMAMQANIGKSAQAKFKKLVSSARTQKKMRQLQQTVIQNNRGKSRDQLIAILRKKQKAYATSLQAQAVRSARASVVGRLKRKALDQLIDERLQLQAAKKLNSVASSDQIDGVIKGLATRNKMTPAQFAAHMKKSGANISSMKARMRAQYSWRRMISRRFGAMVAITDAQVDNMLTNSAAISGGGVELQLQRITLALPAQNDQRILTRRFAEAERMRQRFRDCKTMAGLVNGLADAKFEKLGLRKPVSFPEPARTMLLSAKDGQMTPPMLETAGIEFFAVCGRRAIKGDAKARAKAQSSLREKEFAVLARRHLRDLRTDAHICRRQDASYAMHLSPCN